MPRLRTICDEEADASVEPELLRLVRNRRGGGLSPVDGLLLHSPPVAEGWHALFGALAGRGQLDLKLRELALVRVGLLTGGRYALAQHLRIARELGVPQVKLDALEAWEACPLFDEKERAVLAYADAMTRDVQVPAEIFDALRPHFDARELVELTANIAAYAMVVRFMEALDLAP